MRITFVFYLLLYIVSILIEQFDFFLLSSLFRSQYREFENVKVKKQSDVDVKS
jgi:hypothetical protein